MMASHLSLDTATSQLLDRGIEDDVRHNMY
jgi:hypothetical protein